MINCSPPGSIETSTGCMPIEKNGPTVCEGVTPSGMSHLHRCLLASAQYDVEPIAKRVSRRGCLPVECTHQSIPRVFIRDGIPDGVCGEQRIPWKIHLRDQSSCEGGTEYREMDVSRPPRIVMIAPRVCAGLDSCKGVPAITIGSQTSATAKVWIKRRVMLIGGVCVTACRIRLPDFDQGSADRTAVFINHPATDDDSFAEWRAAMLARQIALARAYVGGGKPGAGDFGQG